MTAPCANAVLASTVVASPASKLARRLLRRNLVMCSSRVRGCSVTCQPRADRVLRLARTHRGRVLAGGGIEGKTRIAAPTGTPSQKEVPNRYGDRPVTEGSRL